MGTTSVTGALYQQLLLSASLCLDNNRDAVNNLNVFPVPDGDTGTNMSLTMSAVTTNHGHDTDSISEYSANVARDMMRAARGNSGVILSLFFRGMARAFDGHDTADINTFREAFRAGAVAAASAVEKPVEGTILTVMRECCAGDCDAEDIESLLDLFYEKASETLAKTPEMLPVLKRARVVDSGGCGFVHIVDGMRKALSGEPIEVAPITEYAINEAADFSEFSDEEITFTFCTECLLDLEAPVPAVILSNIRSWLASVGDSMVLTTDEEIFKLHIHTNEPMEVLARVTKLGTLRFSKIENMRLQHDGIAVNSGSKKKEKKIVEREPYGIFAVSPGDGFSDLLCELGADRIIAGGQSMNPSADDIIEAIKSFPCETAIILPNNSNIILTAKQVARLMDDVNVLSVDTRTLPQGITSLIAFNKARTPEENIAVMQSVLSDVKTLSVTTAVRDAETDGVTVHKDQLLGLLDGKIKVSSDSLEEVIETLVAEAGDGEIISVYYGEDATEESAEAVAAIISEKLPSADIAVLPGGQPIYPYIISVE